MTAWEDQFGKTVQTTDFAGRKIQKGAFDQKTSDYGWTLTFIVPKTEGGSIKPENMICVHVKTAEEKGDDYPAFFANEKKYNVKNEDGVISIEEATDSESIAEQQAKIQSAMERWEQFFGEAENAIDFCGRKIKKSEYNTESELAWKIAPYVTSKPTENKNAYIANVVSVEEALGKTAFKANGKNYTLNKESGAYYFKALEAKPQKKPFEVSDVDEVFERVRLCKANYEEILGSDVWMDFIILKIVTASGVTSATAATLVDSISMLLKEQIGERIAFEMSELVQENGARAMYLTYRFSSPQREALERIFNGCMLLNTYAPLFFTEFALEEFKIYNYANHFDIAQVQYPISLLAEWNPELKKLMTAIYQSNPGFYKDESPVTLYVSDFIVYNIESLNEMHPVGETVYHTPVKMVEHNFVFTELRASIQNKIIGEIRAAQAAQNEAEEEVAANEADHDAYAQAAQESYEEEPVQQAEEPVVEETAAEEPVAEIAEEVAEAPAEAPAEETVSEPEEETAQEPEAVAEEEKKPAEEAPAEEPEEELEEEPKESETQGVPSDDDEDESSDPIETF